MSLHVYKFGGISIGSIEAIKAVAHIVGSARARDSVVVVVSAMSGVTDALLTGARQAVAGQLGVVAAIAHDLAMRHRSVAADLIADRDECRRLKHTIAGLLHEFERSCQAIALRGDVTPCALDTIAALGERLVTPLIAAVLRDKGLPAEAVDAASIIVTDDQFGNATPLLEQTNRQINVHLRPLLEQDVIPIVTGFLGATASGQTTTLGRGGSDYSAAIIGAALDADAVVFYKEVDGVLTTDPRFVSNARLVPHLDYHEAAALSYFGAKILHPMTIQPLIDKQIPISIKNTFNPERPGTIITGKHAIEIGSVKAVTALDDVSMVMISGPDVWNMPEIVERVLTLVAQVQSQMQLMSHPVSDSNIYVVLPPIMAAMLRQMLEVELVDMLGKGMIESIRVQDQVAIISVIGYGVSDNPTVAARVTSVCANLAIPMYGIALNSSNASMSLVIASQYVEQALQAVHELAVG